MTALLSTEAHLRAILKNIAVFQGLTEEEYGEIIPLLDPLNFPADKEVIVEGSEGQSMYILIRGTVKVTKRGDSDDQILLQYLYPGSYFGEFSLLDHMPRSASVTTTEEAELFCLSKSAFDRLLEVNKSIATHFFRNCLTETFSRFRNITSSFTFSQRVLKEKSAQLNEIGEDLALAKRVQQFFVGAQGGLGENHPLRKIKVDSVYQPCIDIGGDLVNLTPVGEKSIGLIIADVAGHGITGALATGVLKSAFTLLSDEWGSRPKELLSHLNRHFCELVRELFATCYYAHIEELPGGTYHIKLSKAGHPQPLFLRKNGDFERVSQSGTCLGFHPDSKFEEIDFTVNPGDKIIFYTDGVAEQVNPKGEMYTDERLAKKFHDLAMAGEKKILPKIMDDFKHFADGMRIEDDVTLLILEF
ncbi:MAG: SpoIIE family protein phosphatase [Spirochaetia bacterium]|nr:SpoIIE family protein phosphatase [Spirochaetia bacterium]